MTTESLHFKVHAEGLLRLIREIYWYEDNHEKADNILGSIGDGEITIGQRKRLLEGDAYFISTDDGDTITYVEKPDKEWKKDLAEHKAFLKERKEKDEKVKKENYDRLQADLDKREREESLFGDYEISPEHAKMAAYVEKLESEKSGYDKAIDKLQERGVTIKPAGNADDLLEELTTEANMNIAKRAFVQKWLTKDPEEKARLEEIEKTFANKQFNFVFQSHNYTFQDSARNQGACPHCDAKCKSTMWNPHDDPGTYIGCTKLGDQVWAWCFECPECHEKFFYHQTKSKEEYYHELGM